MAYPELYPPEDRSYRPTPVQHTMFLERVDRNAAKTIVEFLESSDAPLRAHDGTLTIVPRPDGGICVTAQLPSGVRNSIGASGVLG